MDLFSIKNKIQGEKVYKVITILGIKIKIKNKEKSLHLRLDNINEQLLSKDKKIQQLDKKIQDVANKLKDDFVGVAKRITPQPYINQVSIDICHHCNLNCRGCDHFSPIGGEDIYDLEQYRNDIEQLSKLTKQRIDRIGIMGGEPLLNPKVLEYLKIARQYFPNTKIRLVTNGILLEKQNEEFWTTLKDYNIFIEYTKYPLNLNYAKWDELINKYEVPIDVFGYNMDIVKTSYKIPLDLKGNQNPMKNFLNCNHANHCISLKDGRLYTCTVAPNIKYFNKHFGYDIPLTEYDGIDIYKAGSMQEVLEYLAKPMPFCKYCDVKGRSYHHEWGVSQKDINEWVN